MQPLIELLMRIQRTNNLNKVFYIDTVGHGNAYHQYQVLCQTDFQDYPTCIDIKFQNGARKNSDSISGVLESDLLEIVRHRLQCFQSGEYATRENEQALLHIEQALMWLDKRAQDRAERGVLGTMNK